MRQTKTDAPEDSKLQENTLQSDPRRLARPGQDRIENRILSASAMDWLGSLPNTLYPFHLVHAYPRVCNCMAALWQDPRLMISYFEDLLIDHRGTRQGFPSAIASEIFRLKEHFRLNFEARTASITS